MKKQRRWNFPSKNPHFDPSRFKRLVRKLTEYYRQQIKKGLLDKMPPNAQIDREAMELMK